MKANVRIIEDGMDPHLAERITINQVYDKYIGQKYDLKATTRANYIYTYDHFVREGFGKRKLASINTLMSRSNRSVCKRDSFEADQSTDLKNVLLLSVH